MYFKNIMNQFLSRNINRQIIIIITKFSEIVRDTIQMKT